MEAFQFVRGPAQSDNLRGNVPNIPAPPPVLDHEIFDRGIIDQRIRESQAYLCRLKTDGLQNCTLPDFVEAERYVAEVQIASIVRPLLRIAPRANANEVVALMTPLIEQRFEALTQAMQQRFEVMQGALQQRFEVMQGAQQQRFEVIQGALQQRFEVMQADLRGQLDASRNETQQQFRILQYNMAALAFNSSALHPEAPIRALQNNAGIIPVRFPATRGAFQSMSARRVQHFLEFYEIHLPLNANAKAILASHMGLRATA